MPRFFRHIGAWALAGFFSWTTVVLAAAPLRALRLMSPFWVYWPTTMLMTSGLWHLGLPTASLVFACVALIVGLYTEIENWGGSRGTAGVGALTAFMAVLGVGFGSWCRDQKVSPVATLQHWVDLGIQKMREVNPSFDSVLGESFQTDMIVANSPSLVIIFGLIVIAVAVVSEKTWMRILEPEQPAWIAERPAWNEFRAWNELIFLFMAGLLAAFTNHGSKIATIVGTNVLNALFVIYFFQGMAVVFKAMDRFKVGVAWRLLIGFVLTFQLALLVACVGIADYWLEFRARFSRGPMHPSAESKQ